MLIGAARKALIVTFEVVDDHGVFEWKPATAGTADETDQGTNNATEDPFIMLPSGPVSPHRISAANGQNKVNEARRRAEISIDERVDGTRDQRSRRALL